MATSLEHLLQIVGAQTVKLELAALERQRLIDLLNAKTAECEALHEQDAERLRSELSQRATGNGKHADLRD